MYVIKNALRSISRSKGRSILIGIIVLVIAVSTCVALSIRQAADTAKKDTLDGLSITATISQDRSSMMNDIKNNTDDSSSSDAKEDIKDKLASMESLTLDEMQTYANAKSVSDFYYTISSSVDGNDDFEAVDSTGGTSATGSSTSSDTSNENGSNQTMPQGAGDMGGGKMFSETMGTQGDFTLIGYSADDAMTDFVNGTSSITDGAMFDEGTSENQCVISNELATYNDLAVGDTITVTNPNNEDETIDLTIVGIYTGTSSTSSNTMNGFSVANDSANQILMSYNAVSAICTASEDSSGDDALKNQVNGTYCFASVDDYNNFQTECEELGLDTGTYQITSADLTEYENSLLPIENLSKYATYFLIVVLVIGAIILTVLNIFNIRERKYEIGVLSAIGMKKRKICAQFMTEMLVLTFIVTIIGTGIGAGISVPVTNALLSSQITATEEQNSKQTENFGREMGGGPQAQGGTSSSSSTTESSSSGDNSSTTTESSSSSDTSTDTPTPFVIGENASNYVSEVSSATNMTVFFELILIALALTLVSSLFAVIFVLRYDPLKILSNRD